MTSGEFIATQAQLATAGSNKCKNSVLGKILGKSEKQIANYRTGNRRVPTRAARQMELFRWLALNHPDTWQSLVTKIEKDLAQQTEGGDDD